jgi:hypothetical protein
MVEISKSGSGEGLGRVTDRANRLPMWDSGFPNQPSEQRRGSVRRIPLADGTGADA